MALVKNELTDDLYYTIAHGYLLQIMNTSATKWNGIKAMLDVCNCSPFVFGQGLWVEVACRLRSMQIVDSYIRKRGLDFIRDPEVIAIILQEDYVELMDFCLKLKLDKGMRLSDGRSLYEAAVSDEMRALLEEHLIPPSLGDR